MNKLICIVCPKGCHLEVDDKNNVFGNSCARGKSYAISEITNPVRMLTSTVKVVNSDEKRLPVATDNPIPKSKIFDVMNEINKVVVTAPININDIIIENVLNLNVNIKATKTIK